MLKLVIDVSKHLHAADDFSGQHFQMHFFVAELMWKLKYCVVQMDWHATKDQVVIETSLFAYCEISRKLCRILISACLCIFS